MWESVKHYSMLIFFTTYSLNFTCNDLGTSLRKKAGRKCWYEFHYICYLALTPYFNTPRAMYGDIWGCFQPATHFFRGSSGAAQDPFWLYSQAITATKTVENFSFLFFLGSVSYLPYCKCSYANAYAYCKCSYLALYHYWSELLDTSGFLHKMEGS